jgi:hypothetical protein
LELHVIDFGKPGPMLCAGNELATAASQAMGVEMQFENISQ